MRTICKYSIVAIVLFFGGSGTQVLAQEIKVIRFAELETKFNSTESKIKVINFWATWCKPCIEELPYFEKISEKYGSKEVTVELVSMDFLSELDRLTKFVKRRDLQSKISLLNEPDYDSWIEKVDPSWSGAIPATLIINADTGERKFYEKSFKKGELELEIDVVLNK